MCCLLQVSELSLIDPFVSQFTNVLSLLRNFQQTVAEHTHTGKYQHASVMLSCLRSASISLEVYYQRHCINMLLAYIHCKCQLLRDFQLFATLHMLHSSFVCNNQGAFNTG